MGALLLALAPARAADPAPVPVALRVEYSAAPLGLDEPAPRLAWRSPVARQSAYRIQVAFSPEALAAGDLVWDSGKVASDANVQIAYAGPPLASRRRYWWRVQAWDAEYRPSGWSAPGWWEMGLLAPADWQAQWIAGREPLAHDWGDLTLDVELTLTGKAVDVLFRALPHGKTYGDAYVWTLSDGAEGAALTASVRRYPGGSSATVKTDVLKCVPLGTPLKGGRHRLTIRAEGSRIETRFDGRIVDTLEDTTHARGTVGFAAAEAQAATIHSVAVAGTGSAALRTSFARNDNPFTGGSVEADGLAVAAGVSRVAFVLPIEAPAPLVRRAFDVARKPIARARLYHAGAGMPRIVLNGAQVGSPLGAGFIAYDKRALSYTHDVTALLRPGANVLGAELGRGWYALTDPDEWYFHAAPWRADPALKAQLEIDYADGTRQTIATDGSWRTAPGPTRSDSVHRGERYDARLLPVGWDRPGFRANWQAAMVVPGPTGKLVAANAEPIEPVETIAPASVKEVAPGIWVHDFGRIIAGWPVLEASGPRGVTVSMMAGEKRAADGRVVPASGLIHAQLQTDRYTLAGRGIERWEPSFGYRGFRYVELRGLPGAVLKARIVHSNVARTGSFASADPLLGRIDAAATGTILNNLHGFVTDTPTYEKNGWTGDAQASAGAAARSLDIARIWTKWLADFRDAQAPSGELPEIVPATPNYGYENTPGWSIIWGPTTPWDAAALILPWELYATYGDTRILERSHDMQRRVVDYTATFIKAPGFRRETGLSEWMPPGPLDFLNARGGGVDAVTTAYFFHEADLLARSSMVIGKAEDAARYRQLAEAIRAAYNARYWDDANGWYRTVDAKGVAGPPTQVQNVLPLAFGMAPAGREQGVADAIARDVAKQGLRTGVFGTRYLLEILSDYGHADLAYRVATRTDEPSWGWWIANGHSTMFESWSLESRSRDHHYFASIADWMRQRLAGLRPGAPGYRTVLVKPAIPAGLAHAEAVMETIHGRAASRWQVENGRLRLTAEVPANTSGEVWVPERFGAITAPAGAELLRREGGHAVYRTGPGLFEFRTGGGA
ncbi:glycoside hydrolase family 78 protein [Sphingomonas sp. BT-65]|uniref:glycoside hydrolase family 78 protein n=1 Tax=Sphingomonas sp. BT-65 TaxID=2989821 RepID=UPI0022357432|nr:glycoside hydrolase family 78 protein [Sphingomonas sp. BT-65]MCW4461997.1 glycoside hydrolase family 78 protein [Sphingomonas sp. BT-65]